MTDVPLPQSHRSTKDEGWRSTHIYIRRGVKEFPRGAEGRQPGACSNLSCRDQRASIRYNAVRLQETGA